MSSANNKSDWIEFRGANFPKGFDPNRWVNSKDIQYYCAETNKWLNATFAKNHKNHYNVLGKYRIKRRYLCINNKYKKLTLSQASRIIVLKNVFHSDWDSAIYTVSGYMKKKLNKNKIKLPEVIKFAKKL